MSAPDDSVPLALSVVSRDPRTLRLLEVNAHYMTKVEYDRLVDNMRRDQVCSSTPLIWADPEQPGAAELVLSGNNRVKAAIDAGLAEVTCQLICQSLSPGRRTAIQLSHNALHGEDDPALLGELYASIADVDLRAYCGLDDKTLALLATVSPEPFGEEPLAFATVALLFLPPERDRFVAALAEAVRVVDADELLAARYADHRAFLAALDTVRDAHRVGAAAIALGLILDVFDAHLGDVRRVWLDEESGQALVPAGVRVPLETVFETRTLPADAAAVLARAVDLAQARGDVAPTARWRVLELWAADYLAGPD